jgi:hypothetical protein
MALSFVGRTRQIVERAADDQYASRMDDAASGDVATRLAADFVRFADAESGPIPMYQRLVRAAAVDLDVLSILYAAPPGQRRPVLLLAALHDLLLDEPGLPLARWYPSITGHAPPGDDPWPTARELLLDRRDHFEQVVATRTTQTNEVNRSAIWFSAMRAACTDLADTAVALLELGSSAGLNLRWDRYRVGLNDDPVRGHLDSKVELSCSIRRGHPPIDEPMAPIVARLGIDRDPIRVDDERSMRWLRACVWPEQMVRLARFDAAVSELQDDPPSLIRGDAVDELADAIESLPNETHLVVFHSWFLTYVARDRRAAIDEQLSLAARDRPVTRLTYEGAGVTPGFDDVVVPGADRAEFRSILGMSRWRSTGVGGSATRTDRVLGACHAHGDWLDWLD